MMNMHQETEAGSVLNVESNPYAEPKNKAFGRDFGRELQFRNETSGGNFKRVFLGHDVLRIIEQLLRTLNETKNASIVEEAKDLISNIVEFALDLQRLNVDISNIPSLYALNLEDGSLLIEWLFPNYRIGFSIEPNIKDSSWYLVSTVELIDYNTSGTLSNVDKKALLVELLSFVVKNS